MRKLPISAVGAAGAVGGKIAAEVVGEGIEAGGRIVAGALQGIGSAVGGAAQGLGSAIGGALQGALTEGPKTIVNNVGIVGSAGKQNIVSGGGMLPAPKKAAKPAYNEKMPTEKLLAVAVTYLTSIDNTLRTQIENDRLAFEKKAQAEKEAAIESKGNSVFNKLGAGLGAAGGYVKEKTSKWDVASKLITGGLLLGGLGAIGISQLDTSELDALKENVATFKKDWGWLAELGAIATGALQGAAIGARGGPWGLIIGAIGGALISYGWIQNDKRNDYIANSTRLFSKDAQTKAEKYFNRRLMNQRGGDPTKDSPLESIRPQAGSAEDVQFLKNDLKKQGYSNAQIDTILFDPQYKVDAVLQSAPPPTSDTVKPTTTPDENQQTIPQTAYDVVWANGAYGDPQRDTGKLLSQMTVDEVLAFQKNVLAPNTKAKQGIVHTPVGAYQFVYDTLKGYRDSGVVSGSDLFNAQTQDKLAKTLWNASRGGDMSQTWAYTAGSSRGQFANTDFESVKDKIVSNEVGSYVGMTPSGPASGTNANVSTIESALDMAKKIFGKAGGALIGTQNYTSRPITQNIADPSTKIQDMSKKIETAMIDGKQQKVSAPGALATTATQQSIVQASNDGTLGALDPNYPGSKDLIMTYLAHWKFAA